MEELARCIGEQAVILKKTDPDGAMALLEEQGRIWRDVGDDGEMAACLANMAMVLTQQGNPEEALPLVEEARRLAADGGPTTFVMVVMDFVKSRLR